MTDNFDLDPHEHEAHAEDEQAHESKAEAWPDDQPPVDDFADPGAEETATASEETGGPLPEEGTEIESRKSSALLPIMAGVGGLLLLGAILYWQFGHSSSPTAPLVPPPPPLQMTQAQPPINTMAAPTNLPTKTMTSDSGGLKQPVASQTMDVAPKTSFAGAEGAPAGLSSASASAGTAMPAPPSSGPPPAGFPSAGSPAQVNSVTADGSPIDARLNNLATRIDELKKELDQATQQLTQVNSALASPSTSGNAVLEDRLNKIEQQVEQMQHAPPVLASPSVLAVPDSSASPSSPVAENPTPPAPKPVTHKQSAHKYKRTKTAARKAAPPVTASKWVLRAATPDEAWVAKDESSSELHHIRVGDELPGIGHVNAIRQTGDSWIIEGSTGTIH